MMHSMYSFGGGWMMIIWWLLIVVAVVALVKWTPSLDRPNKETDRNTAMEVLKRRYANGEISREEFEERKKVLSV